MAPRRGKGFRALPEIPNVANSRFLCDLLSILMRKGTVWVALLVCTWATGWAQGTRNARPEVLARCDFAGTEQLGKLTSLKALQQVLQLPQSAALRDAAFEGFARRAASRFSRDASTNQQQQIAARVQQLLPDLLRYGTKFEMISVGTSAADWALAVRLPDERVATWRTTLTELARGAGLKVQDEGRTWSAKGENYQLSLSREKNWTVLQGGYSAAGNTATFKDFRRSLNRRAGKQLLQAEINFPGLGKLWESERLSHAPRIQLSAVPNQGGLRSEVQIDYPRDLGIKPEKWNVPTSLIHDPLVGFTAVQGVKERLESAPRFKALGARDVPNQLFTWSVNDTPFSVYFATDVGNPPAVLTNLQNRIVQRLTNATAMSVRPQVRTNASGFVIRGLPVIIPHFEAGRGAASEFLLAGLFPVTGRTNMPPPELFEQLNRRNLIYYDWEITETRLKQWQPIWQLSQILTSEKILRSDAPSETWLSAVAPYLGNTITQGTLEGNRRIRVVRQSHIGFSALELVLLAHRLDPHDFRPAPRVRPPGTGPVPSPAPGQRPPGTPAQRPQEPRP